MVVTKSIKWDIRNVLTHSSIVNCFIQARRSSVRLPDKIYRDINGMPLLSRVLLQVRKSRLINNVIVASPHPLSGLSEETEQFIWSGPENDVLGRFYNCFLSYPCDYIVRVTADCPLLDPELIDCVIENGRWGDYCSNILSRDYREIIPQPGFPDGVDVEMFSAKTLIALHETASSDYDREHVTTLIRRPGVFQDKFNIVSITPEKDYFNIKVSVDTESDLTRVVDIIK